MQAVVAHGPPSLIGAMAEVDIVAVGPEFVAGTHCLASVVKDRI